MVSAHTYSCVQVRESKEKLEKVAVELNEVSRQLADAHGDTAESERNRRRNEAIDSLKRVFPDRVYGRLVDLCQPSHRRFQLAVTKVWLKVTFTQNLLSNWK